MDVVLLGNSYIGHPKKYQGMAIVDQALKEKGIKPRILPLEKFSPKDLWKKSIVAVGAYYYELDKYAELSKQLQAEGHFVILGGHGTYFPKTNKKLLDEGAFNAINRGHAKPFVDFVLNYDDVHPERIAEQVGLATKNKPYVKNGEFPELKHFPLIKYSAKFGTGFEIPSMRTCENKCDFCSEHMLKTPDITDLVIESLKEYEMKHNISSLFFANPSFNEENISDIRKILSSLKQRPEVRTYLDSFQAGDPETVKLLDDFNVTGIYLGLNAINNETAAYVGRRYKGNIITNFEAEKENVLNFLNTKRNVKGQERYVVSIMNSRADNEEAIMALINFVYALNDIAWENLEKKISIALYQTIPLPGTRFYNKHKDDYSLKMYSNYSMGMPFNNNIITYKDKSSDFFERTLRARYYLMEGRPSSMMLGLQSLILAYEHVFKGKILTYLYDSKKYKEKLKPDIDFVLNPDKADAA